MKYISQIFIEGSAGKLVARYSDDVYRAYRSKKKEEKIKKEKLRKKMRDEVRGE